MGKLRIKSIDIAKGIGILLIIIGHVSENNYINFFTYSFDVPLFFFLSGYLYKNTLQPMVYIKKKVGKILVPYIMFGLISYLYWVLIERNLRNQTVSPIDALINLFIAQPGENSYIFNVALWFLPCLFITDILFYFLKRKLKKDKILAVFVISFSTIGYIYTKLDFIRLPLCIDISFMAIVFYFLGYMWKNKWEVIFKEKVKKYLLNIIIVGICMILTIIVSQINHGMNMFEGNYNNYFLMYLCAIAGTLMVYLISKIISQNKILEFLGRNSLIIMCIHEPIKRIVIEVIHRISNIQVDILRMNAIFIILITICIILVMLPIILVINKFFPLLIGKNSNIYKNA